MTNEERIEIAKRFGFTSVGRNFLREWRIWWQSDTPLSEILGSVPDGFLSGAPLTVSEEGLATPLQFQTHDLSRTYQRWERKPVGDRADYVSKLVAIQAGAMGTLRLIRDSLLSERKGALGVFRAMLKQCSDNKQFSNHGIEEVCPFRYMMERGTSFGHSRRSQKVQKLDTTVDKVDEQLRTWISEETLEKWGADLLVLSELHLLFNRVVDGSRDEQLVGLFRALKNHLRIEKAEAEISLVGLRYYASRCRSILSKAQVANDNLYVVSTIVYETLWSDTFGSLSQNDRKSVIGTTGDKNLLTRRKKLLVNILLDCDSTSYTRRDKWSDSTMTEIFKEMSETEGQDDLDKSRDPASLMRYFQRALKDDYPGPDNMEGWFTLAEEWHTKFFLDTGQDTT